MPAAEIPDTPPASTADAPASFDAAIAVPRCETTNTLRRDTLRAAALVAAVSVACVIGYLVVEVPGAWFTNVNPLAWNVKSLGLVRGSGGVERNELVVATPDATGIALVNVVTDFRASEYPGVAWVVAGLADDADARLLWRTDFQPDKVNSVALAVEGGDTRTATLAGNAGWIGHITGIALAIRGPFPQPLRIRGVIAKPMNALDVARRPPRQWLAFERWNGTSINTVVGGVDDQDIYLPAVVALVGALSGVAVAAIRRWRPGAFHATLPALVAGLFVAGWLLLDVRWTWNLLRQEHATAVQYAGKTLPDKLLAGDDGPLYAFIERALAILPKTPARVFIASDADYFRGRAAYHLYPHRVFYDPRSTALPPASAFRSGDWLLVYQRRGIQFDAEQRKIRWSAGDTVSADPQLVESGAALFLIR